jgi:ribosomal protein S18 acetylase RimI-like enzyme
MIGIRKAERADIDALVELMARAFQEAALYRHLVNDAEKRPAFLRMVFRRRIAFDFDNSLVDLAIENDSVAGAAIWLAPAETPRQANHELNNAVRDYEAAVYKKWQRFHGILFDSMARVLPEPHWSLAPIAVLPEAQGRGVASALLRSKFAEFDASGAPCLLGTQDEINTKIYAHYGFRIASEDRIAHDLTSYVMVRDSGNSQLQRIKGI